jgi:hypothetical protein
MRRVPRQHPASRRHRAAESIEAINDIHESRFFIRSANVDALLAPEHISGAELGASLKQNAVTPRNNPPLPLEYRCGKGLRRKAITEERSMTMLRTQTLVVGVLAAILK